MVTIFQTFSVNEEIFHLLLRKQEASQELIARKAYILY